ncbi:hydroxymethylglutaryl-CoA reductase, degradative [Sulfoacidibacillus thermotolerans]|uniref:3-hydroxy-3-methylglutaryl coenzyme A reductase n=1 Tax=Sulfoacidibacillus thermotolerans TaxID=1765684 RepID=A0A2U3D9C4_SULT2|nr:hydroxymethylglutaryl-CoA reductase, degradative [Sulfoacidibacillus thermotolerans]PWI57865.1 hydroxymethylglutaryl-CoA reductase, degradative [Sulfoacidibacillus thermotolerans]
MSKSRFPGFYRLSVEERVNLVAQEVNLTKEEKDLLFGVTPFSVDRGDFMIENVVGMMPLPLGIAVNFKINGKEILVPMVIEEPSVVAAASNMARAAYESGGFTTSYSGSMMRAQVQVVDVADPYAAMARIYEHRSSILELCNSKDPTLVSFGGGARDIEVFVLHTQKQPMVILHLLVDTRDAMGANTVNTMAEAVAPFIEQITAGRVLLRIISNLADRRLVRARTVVTPEAIGGHEVVENILLAQQFAEFDPYRAATHNKGIMNGISAVVLATGNDTRAVEAGAHAYACRSGRYMSLTRWEKDGEGNLVGTLEIPMAVGIVGGATKSHPFAQLALKIMGVHTAEDLAGIIASVGLAQNLGALRALASEGIQQGHMALHARNLAIMAGAEITQVDEIVKQAIAEKNITYDHILELVKRTSTRVL